MYTNHSFQIRPQQQQLPRSGGAPHCAGRSDVTAFGAFSSEGRAIEDLPVGVAGR